MVPARKTFRLALQLHDTLAINLSAISVVPERERDSERERGVEIERETEAGR